MEVPLGHEIFFTYHARMNDRDTMEELSWHFWASMLIDFIDDLIFFVRQYFMRGLVKKLTFHRGESSYEVVVIMTDVQLCQ